MLSVTKSSAALWSKCTSKRTQSPKVCGTMDPCSVCFYLFSMYVPGCAVCPQPVSPCLPVSVWCSHRTLAPEPARGHSRRQIRCFFLNKVGLFQLSSLHTALFLAAKSCLLLKRHQSLVGSLQCHFWSCPLLQVWLSDPDSALPQHLALHKASAECWGMLVAAVLGWSRVKFVCNARLVAFWEMKCMQSRKKKKSRLFSFSDKAKVWSLLMLCLLMWNCQWGILRSSSVHKIKLFEMIFFNTFSYCSIYVLHYCFIFHMVSLLLFA